MQGEVLLNQQVIERFRVLKAKNRLAHAYLFIGPLDIGKGETAFTIAKLVNCESKKNMFCDTCPSCVKINSGNHPDITVIDNGYREAIRIEQIRELLGRNKLRPFLAEKKVFIIKNIENLTLESANAFLKTLEEPTADSLLILTTSVPEKNLDTIRSRCHAMHFQPISNNDLIKKLEDEYSMDGVSSHFLSYFAQGCLGTVERLRKEQFIERKNEFIDALILNRPEDDVVKELLSDKVQTKIFLDVLLSWMRDVLLAKCGVEDNRLIHCDRIKDLKQFGKKYTFDELNEINKSVIRMHQLLADNLNIKLPLLIIGEQLWEK